MDIFQMWVTRRVIAAAVSKARV